MIRLLVYFQLLAKVPNENFDVSLLFCEQNSINLQSQQFSRRYKGHCLVMKLVLLFLCADRTQFLPPYRVAKYDGKSTKPVTWNGAISDFNFCFSPYSVPSDPSQS